MGLSLGASISVLFILVHALPIWRLCGGRLRLALAAAPLVATLAPLLSCELFQAASGHLGFEPPLRTFLVIYCVCLASLAFISLHGHRFDTEEVQVARDAIACGLIGAIIWIIPIARSGSVPRDSDALSHAVNIQRIFELRNPQWCRLPASILENGDRRFYPCASHFFGSLLRSTETINSAQALNVLYVVAGFIFGMCASLLAQHLSSRRVHLLAMLASLSFLAFPYALNGLLPLSFGLSCAVGALCLVTLNDGRPRILVWLLVAAALYLIHPLATLPFVSISILSAFHGWCKKAWHYILLVAALGLLAVAAVASLRVMMPNSSIVLNIDNAIRANDVKTLNFSTAQLILGNIWTRGQPEIIALICLGVFATVEKRPDFRAAMVTVLAVSYLLFEALYSGIQNWPIRLFSAPFYGQWYRVLAVFVIVAAPFASVGANELLTKRRRKVAFTFVGLMTSISCLTGYRIVQQAWSRPNSIAEAASEMKNLSFLPQHRLLNTGLNGSAWAYPVAGAKVISTNFYGKADVDLSAVERSMSDPNELPYVCLYMKSRGLTGNLSTIEHLNRIDTTGQLFYRIDRSTKFAVGYISDRQLIDCIRRLELRSAALPEWWPEVGGGAKGLPLSLEYLRAVSPDFSKMIGFR